MKNYIFGHTSKETALEVKNYPYGRLRTSMFYYIETTPKKGDRLVQWTINPKNGRVNAEKKSTYITLGVMYINTDNNHIEWSGVGMYTERAKVEAFIEEIGGIDKLTDTQRANIAEILNIGKSIARPVIKGVDYKVSFEKAPAYNVEGENVNDGGYSEAKITFDRPDGVSVKEIFEALKGMNQDKLQKVFNGWQSKHYGVVKGFVRVCVRGGMQLTTVREEAFKEFLSSDYVTTKQDEK